MQSQKVILLATVHSAEVTGEDRLIGSIKIPLHVGAKLDQKWFHLSHARGEEGGMLELKVTYASHVARKCATPGPELNGVVPVADVRQYPAQGQDLDAPHPHLTMPYDLPMLQTYDNDSVPEGMSLAYHWQ